MAVYLSPEFKHAFLRVSMKMALISTVYAEPQRRLQDRIDVLVAENVSRGATEVAISFRGKVHKSSHWPESYRAQLIPRAHPTLLPAMLKFHEDYCELEQEMELTGSSIVAVLNSTVFPDDLRKLFPECLHDGLNAFIGTYEDYPICKPLEAAALQALQQRQAPYLAKLQHRMMWTVITT